MTQVLGEDKTVLQNLEGQESRTKKLTDVYEKKKSFPHPKILKSKRQVRRSIISRSRIKKAGTAQLKLLSLGR